jgi:lipopolysaccharide export system protein LptA
VRLRRLCAIAVCLFGVSAIAGAQTAGGRCIIELKAGSDSTRFSATSSGPDAPRNFFGGGRVISRCLNQDVSLVADSVEWYQQAQVLYLLGNVKYAEPRVTVSSDQMNYFQVDERLIAIGRVVATLPSTSVMRADTATYYRAVRGIRPQSRLVAQNRPRLLLAQRDSTGKAGEPVQVTANQITTENDSIVYAGGKVEITRSDLDARSDSAYLDSGSEFARLMIKPVIIGKGEQGYTLRGRQVELYTRNRIVQRVLAQAEARVTSEDMLLTADTIDLRVDGNKAQAAYIWGKSRARAVSPDRDLIADSLAVRMPDQQLREVRAYRDAMATTFPDTATVRTGEKDWLKGDTIFAFFDSTATRRPAPQPAPVAASATGAATAPTPAAPTDTATTKPRLREMQSIGHASARYQVSSEGSSPERPAINYSRGDRITVVLDSTGVSRVQIDEHAVGLYLEPSYMTADSSDRPSEAPTPAPAPLPTPVPARAPAATSPAPARPATPVRKPAAKPAAVTPRTTPSRP